MLRDSLAAGATSSGRFLTATVTRGDIEQTVLATGTIKPSRLVAVGSQASGRITAVNVALGQRVKAGELLAEIDSVTQQNALRTAQASLASLRAQRVEKQATLALNEATLQRRTHMLAQETVSRADYETAIADVGVTRAQISALDAQIEAGEVAVETARANLGYTHITAPIDGTVLSIVSQQGQTVNATQSAPTIIVLGQLDTMTVRTDISEADIVHVTPGLPVYFSVIGEPDHRYAAHLDVIEPAPDSIRSDSSFSSTTASSATSSSSSSSSSEAVYYTGVFDVPNPEGRLLTYMTAEVRIVLGSARDVLTIPSAALGARDAQGRYAVRVVANGQAVERAVEVGLNDKINAEVRAGLSEGEQVVIDEASGTPATSAASRPPGPPIGL